MATHWQQHPDLIDSLATHKIIFVGGKGGVGKTTTAAAIAVNLAQSGKKTLIVSTDPAHSLGDVLKQRLSDHIQPVSSESVDFESTHLLYAAELDPNNTMEAHFTKVAQTLSRYTKPDMMAKMQAYLKLSKAAPGAEEAAVLEALCQYMVNDAEQYDHVVFDTAPTGHTLRLLTLPDVMSAWTDGLLTQQRRQAKLKAAAEHLSGAAEGSKLTNLHNPFAPEASDRWQQAVETLEARKQLFRQANQLLQDRSACAIVMVMIPEMLSLNETLRACQHLQEAQMECHCLVINQVLNGNQSDPFWQQRADRQGDIITKIKNQLANYPKYFITLKQDDIRGRNALQHFL